MNTFKPLARRSDIVVQEFDKETLIYDLSKNRAFHLNESSAFVWEFSNGQRTVSEIADALNAKIQSPITNEFVLLAIDQLIKGDLIEPVPETESFPEEFNRREIVRKIGFTTVAALPIVSNLIVPFAVQAASCVAAPFNNGCPCAANANCSSNCCATTPSGNTCVATPGIEPPGSGCRAGCECASGSCPPAAPGNPRVCV